MPLSESCILSSFYPQQPQKPGSLVDLVFENFDSFPDHKIAVLDDASGRRYSFKDLKRLTGQVASGLAKRGLGKGHVLSLFGANCIENAPITYGALVTGATVQLVKPKASQHELRFHFSLVEPRIIVTTAGAAHNVLEAVREADIHLLDIYVIGGAVDGCRRAEELLEDPGDANPWGRVEIDPREDVALMMPTGGTTGMSKTVMITHEAAKQAVLELTTFLPEAFGDDLCLGYIPFHHSWSVDMVYGTWLRHGCGVVNVNTYDPELHLRAIEKNKITRMAITPPVLVTLVSCPSFAQANLSSLLSVRCGGSSMSAATQEHLLESFFKAAPNAEFSQMYGMTELGAATAFPPISHPIYKQKMGSVGVVLPDIELRVVSCDEQQRPCGPGEMGQILLRSPRIMKGYFKNEKATRKAIVDGWYITGDFGYFDDDGYVFVIDRVEDLIKHKDGIVLPTYVEGILRSHPGVKDCAVIGRSSSEDGGEGAGQVAMAFVVRKDDCDVSEEELQRFGADRLAPHEQLAGGVRFVGSIPKLPAGKMPRRVLREQL